jgi:integrase
LQHNSPPNSGTPAPEDLPLWDIHQAADFFHVSASWIRRHLSELPHSRHGRLIRFDPDELKRRVADRKSLEPKEKPMAINRFQRGTWKVVGKKKMVWGTFRLEERDAKGERIRKSVALGLRKEFATKTAVDDKLKEVMREYLNPKPDAVKKPDEQMLYSELVEAWKEAVKPVLGESTFDHYANSLRAYVPENFMARKLASIQNADVVGLVNTQAKKYSESTLRSLRLVLCMTLSWAEKNSKIVRPTGWLNDIRIPKVVGGRKVKRVELEPCQTAAIIAQLEEPYASLVRLLDLLGRRIEEAIGVQAQDLDENNVLTIRRIIYKGKVTMLEADEIEVLPLDAVVHGDLIRFIRASAGRTWVFQSRKGTPVNPGNFRRRYLHPAAKAIGVKLGGTHDFRHTLKRRMRRAGVDPVVVRDTMGHKRVEQQEVYDAAKRVEVGDALRLVGSRMAPTLAPNRSVQ